MASTGARRAEGDDDLPRLELASIRPRHRWRLIRDILDRADGKRVVLSVLAVNHRAYWLYRRLGFTEISRDGVAPEVRIRMAFGR
jgi:hypothetical protein